MRSHGTSFGAKIGALAVGEVVFLPDEFPEGGRTGPSKLERAVHTAVKRSPRARGKRFHTARADAICNHTHWTLLKIERLE